MDDLDRYQHRERDASRIARLRDGDDRAFGELYDDWYDRVFDLARRIVRDDELAADVAQDTFLSAWRSIDTLEDPNAFGGWLLRIARNRALNVGGREGRSVAVDDTMLHTIEATGVPVSAPSGFGVEDRLARADDPATAVEDAELVSLLWDAADALGERDRTVLDLQLRHGMTPAEIGEVVGVNRNAANQLVHRVKGRLDSAVRARVLWAGDEAACAVLRAELVAAGLAGFDEQSAKLAGRHADGCDECGERRQLRLQPAAMFGAVPIMIAPALFKQQAAAALTASGVPLQGSTASGGFDAASAASKEGVSKDVGSKDVGSKEGASNDPGSTLRPDAGEAMGSEWIGPGQDGEPTKSVLASTAVEGGDEKGLDDRAAAAHDASTAARSGSGKRRLAAAALVVALLVLLGGVAVVMAGDGDDDAQLETAASAPTTSPPSTMLASGGPDEPTALAPAPAERMEPAGHPDDLAPNSTSTTTTSSTSPGLSSTTRPGIVVIPPGPRPDPEPDPTPDPTGPGPSSPDVTTAPSTTRPPPTTTTTSPPAPVTASLTLTPTSALPTYLFASGPELRWSTSGGASVTVAGNNLNSTARNGSARVCPGMLVAPSCSSIPGTYRYVLEVRDGDGDLLARRTVTLTIA